MSTLRISNIEAKADSSSPTVDEQLKFTNSDGDLMLYLDGRTAGITTVGINTTNQTIKFDSNNNILITGIVTATEFHGTLAVGTSVTYGDNEKEYFGTGLDLELFHNGTNSVINNTTGALLFQNNGSSSMYIGSTGQVYLNNDITFVGASANALWDKSENYFSIPDKIVHSGDTNTAIRFPAADTISMETAGNERIRITSAGNVGINSTAPTGKLDIATGGNSFIKFGQDADNPKMEMFRSTGGSPSHYGAELQLLTGDFVFSNAPGANLGSHSYTERLRIESNGNLKVTTGTQYRGVNVCKADGGLVAELVGLDSNNDEGGLALWDGGVKKVFLTSNGYSYYMGGNVGINTTTPQQKLVSYADSGYPFVANGPSNCIALNNAGVIVFGTKDVASYASGSFDATDFTFKSSGNAMHTIDSTGKTTISVNKDSTALVIDGTSSGTAYGETGGRIEFLMLNEVNQFTGNFAARISPYLQRGNNGFGLKFDVRHNASTTYKALDITADYSVVPGIDNTITLGSSSYRWSNIYTADLHCSNEGSKNDVDGTWGDYTIQEGESDLFLINNRSGKKYKFNLTEVS